MMPFPCCLKCLVSEHVMSCSDRTATPIHAAAGTVPCQVESQGKALRPVGHCERSNNLRKARPCHQKHVAGGLFVLLTSVVSTSVPLRTLWWQHHDSVAQAHTAVHGHATRTACCHAVRLWWLLSTCEALYRFIFSLRGTREAYRA